MAISTSWPMIASSTKIFSSYFKDNEFYINEINTFPGFTPTSFFARLCKISFDLEFSQILDMLIEEGFKSFQKRRFKWLKEL